MTHKVRRAAAVLVGIFLSFSLTSSASGDTFEDFDASLTYGSVEAIPNPAVVDTQPLRGRDTRRPRGVRRANPGVRLRRSRALRAVDTDAISTIDDDNSVFAVGAGGFNGRTTASIVYTVVGSGPDAATASDVEVLTNSLGYVFSQGSVFLLDADDPTSFDFPANYVVLLFDETPPIEESAASSRRSVTSIPSSSPPARAVTRSTARPTSRCSRPFPTSSSSPATWPRPPCSESSTHRSSLERSPCSKEGQRFLATTGRRTRRVSRTWGASRSRATTSWRRFATPTCGWSSTPSG